MPRRVFAVLCLGVVGLLAFSYRSMITDADSSLAATAGHPHILLVMEENKGYSATLGACSADPYLCSLASSYASVSSWYGVTHPSEPNYVAFDSGGIEGCTTDTACAADTLLMPDLGGQLSAGAIPWVAWMESMPSPCYTGASSGEYALKHDPFAFFQDNFQGACHIQPYPGATRAVATLDSSSNSAPDFVWITPNLLDDMHDGSVTAADSWLRTNVAPILASSWFRDYPSTAIITMDEGDGSQNAGSCCAGSGAGGHIPLVVVSKAASGHGTVGLGGDHYGTLRSIEEAYSVPLLGMAAATGNGELSSLIGGVLSPPSPAGTLTPSASSTPTPPSPTAIASPTPSPTASPTASPSPGGQGSRNAEQWPFLATSIWNMPIGTHAEYAAADLAPVKGLAADQSVVVMDPTAAETAIEQGPTTQTGDRCALGGQSLGTVPLPASLVIPDSSHNNGFAIIGEDGISLTEGSRFARCTVGQPATASSAKSTGTIYDSGQLGATGGSGLSTLGGLLRAGDLTPGSATRHVLRLDIDGEADLYPGTRATCYVWPAVRCDAYGPSQYGGANPALRMGSLLAIPQSISFASLGLKTEAARQLAWTLQNYGAYVVNDSTRAVVSLGTEEGDASFLTQFQQEWGFPFQTVGTTQVTGDAAAWAADIQTILAHLAVVANNASTSVGGGGIPLQPLAPALSAPRILVAAKLQS
jgi:hypothetical protein